MKPQLSHKPVYFFLSLLLLILLLACYFLWSLGHQHTENAGKQVSSPLPTGNRENRVAHRDSRPSEQGPTGDTQLVAAGIDRMEEDKLLKMLTSLEECPRRKEQRYKEAIERARRRKMEKYGLPTDRSKAILALAQEANFEQLVWAIAPAGASDEEASRAAWALAIVLFKNPTLLTRLEDLLLSGTLCHEHSRRLVNVIGTVPGDESLSVLLRLMDSIPSSVLPSFIQALAAIGTIDRADMSSSPEERVFWFDDRRTNTPVFPTPRGGRLPIDGRVLDAYLRLTERKELDSKTENMLASMIAAALVSLSRAEGEPRNLRVSQTEYVRLLTQFLLNRYHAATTTEEQLAALFGTLEFSPLPEVTELFISLLQHSDSNIRTCSIFALVERGAINGEVEDQILRIAQTDPCRSVRRAAAEALVSDGRYGAIKVQLLVDLYGQAKTESERANLVFALGQTNADAFPHLERIALTDPFEYVRQEATRQAELLRQRLYPPSEEEEEEAPDE